jgi:hypothetical protein
LRIERNKLTTESTEVTEKAEDEVKFEEKAMEEAKEGTTENTEITLFINKRFMTR